MILIENIKHLLIFLVEVGYVYFYCCHSYTEEGLLCSFHNHSLIDYLRSKAVVAACDCITVQFAEPYDVLDAGCEAVF
jgi:hypothetical protein